MSDTPFSLIDLSGKEGDRGKLIKGEKKGFFEYLNFLLKIGLRSSHRSISIDVTKGGLVTSIDFFFQSM